MGTCSDAAAPRLLRCARSADCGVPVVRPVVPAARASHSRRCRILTSLDHEQIAIAAKQFSILNSQFSIRGVSAATMVSPVGIEPTTNWAETHCRDRLVQSEAQDDESRNREADEGGC